MYGGSISAITFATPGTPAAAATVYDGFKLMKKGKGKKAILMALYSSVTADFLSDVLTNYDCAGSGRGCTQVRPLRALLARGPPPSPSSGR